LVAARVRWTITPTKFSNQYYKMLTKFEWTEKSWPGEPGRPLQYKNEGEKMIPPPFPHAYHPLVPATTNLLIVVAPQTWARS